MPTSNSLGFVTASASLSLPFSLSPSSARPPRDWELLTARISVVAQILFGLFSLVGFFVPTSAEHRILVSLLILDTVVQGIELSFYLLFLYFDKLSISYRYLDWFFSTPTMLVSLFVFLRYLDRGAGPPLSFGDVMRRDRTPIAWMLVLNAGMLAGGLLVERALVANWIGHGLGFLAFAGSFAILFVVAMPRDDAFGIFLATFVCCVWLLYGVVAAAIAEARWRSTAYNLLDIVSKNLYGVLISAYVLGLM